MFNRYKTVKRVFILRIYLPYNEKVQKLISKWHGWHLYFIPTWGCSKKKKRWKCLNWTLFLGKESRGNWNIFCELPIKQPGITEYHSCDLDSKLSEEAMASKFQKEINAKPNFLYRQSRYLTLVFRILLCNTLIQLVMFSFISIKDAPHSFLL